MPKSPSRASTYPSSRLHEIPPRYRLLVAASKRPTDAPISGAVGDVRSHVRHVVGETKPPLTIPKRTTYIVLESPAIKGQQNKRQLLKLERALLKTGWNITFRAGKVELNSINTMAPAGNRNELLIQLLGRFKREHPEGSIKFYDKGNILKKH